MVSYGEVRLLFGQQCLRLVVAGVSLCLGLGDLLLEIFLVLHDRLLDEVEVPESFLAAAVARIAPISPFFRDLAAGLEGAPLDQVGGQPCYTPDDTPFIGPVGQVPGLFVNCGHWAGVMLAPLTRVEPFMGLDYILTSFFVLVVGGIGTLLGLTAGAGVIGGGRVRQQRSASCRYGRRGDICCRADSQKARSNGGSLGENRGRAASCLLLRPVMRR